MRRPHRRSRGLAAIGCVAVVAVAAVASSVMAGSVTPNPGGDARSTVPQDPVGERDSVRTSVVDDVTWTLSRYSTSSQTCMSVVASIDGAEQGRLDAGCGVSGAGDLQWGLGGLQVADQWFNVAYGQAPPTAVSVNLKLGNGSVLVDSMVAAAGGLWLFVFPDDPISTGSDVDEITALDASGTLVAREGPPSIVEYRENALADPAKS